METTDRTDGQLLTAYVDGADAASFRELYARYAGLLHSICRRYLGNSQDAEDAATACFAVLLKKAAGLKGRPNLGGWLHVCAVRIAKDIVLARTHRWQREREAYEMQMQSQSKEQDKWNELLPHLEEGMAELPDRMREVLVMHFYQGLSRSQIAETLGRPEGSIGTWIARGVDRLREILKRTATDAGDEQLSSALSRLAVAVPAPAGLVANLEALAGGKALSAPIIALVDRAIKRILWGQVKTAVAIAVSVTVICVGAFAAVHAARSGSTPSTGSGQAGLTAGGGEGKDENAADEPAKPAAAGAALPSDWREEQWVPEEFLGALGGGPPMGPADQAAGGAIALCGDKAGNIYLLNGNAIDIVTADGVKHRLAGTGTPGFRDGPANQAQFNQGGDYNVPRSIQCDGQGNIYTAENGNVRVRRIFKDKDGKWMVDTVAGAGKQVLKDGESCPPLEVNLGGMIAVAAAQDGTLTVISSYFGVFRVDADRKAIRKLGAWPGHCPQMADCDRNGNAYFIWRVDDGGVVRVSADGKIDHMAGLTHEEFLKISAKVKSKPYHIGDGPPLTIYIDTPTSLAVSPDGSCVYSCGGDEYDIRRIPTDLKSTTATMLCNGRWYVLPVHGNKNRGSVKFDPNLTGKSLAEGGPLGNLMNCHISGRDYEGNLYGFVYSFVGTTLSVEGKGQLRTYLYRLRRVNK
ncbi:MAG: hypothetical protein C0404_08925 [Verrucomicrobia bacterium]|nr:hypothetical protein [Verrucomicrobiota bacterium]